jgi:serine/threonine protein kinase
VQAFDRFQSLVRFEDCELDLRSGELRKIGGATVRLSEQPFQILVMLLQRPGEVVSREEIRKRLWPNDTVVEFEHSISAAMSRLRQALGENADDRRYIETLARRGYRFVGEVDLTKESPAKAGSPSDIPESAPANLIGKKVSHYRVLEVIGGGGMGIVYKAEDLKLGRRVALKFLPEELAGDEHALKRFEREARAASALNHPNICTIYGIEDHEGQPLISMELLEGRTLREMIPANSDLPPFELTKLIDLGIQITRGLDGAHQKGIIHRDIKPANIFITYRGEAKILDFGVAKLLQVDEPVEPGDSFQLSGPAKQSVGYLTRTGIAMGTEGYMSPEQVRGEKLDARTDLFSLGLVLYEMATGKRAFGGDTATALHEGILNLSPVSARQIRPELPLKLEQIITKALEKDRELRYQGASDIRDDLKSVAASIDHEIRGGIDKPAQYHRWALVGAGIFVGLLVTGVIVRFAKRQPPPLPPMTQQQLTINSSENPVSSGAISPDGRYLAYADLRGIHIKLIATGETRTLPRPESLKDIQVNWGIVSSWTPDGSKLIANAVIPGREYSIWTIPVNGDPAHKLHDNGYAESISRDGACVAFLSSPNEVGYHEIWAMKPDGKDAHLLFESDNNAGFLGSEWSPDGHRLAFELGRRADGKTEWNMITRDLKGGPAVQAIPSGVMDHSWSPDWRIIYSMSEPNSSSESCNFWAVRIDPRTGKLLEPSKRLTNWAGFCVDNPSPTGDGKRLAFRRWSSQGSVYLADIEDDGHRVTPATRLTLNEGLNYPASWTADGKAVIFGSYRDGRWRIFKQAVNEDTADIIDTGPDENAMGSRLSPDGQAVFYISLPERVSPSTPNRIMMVPLAGGSPRLVMAEQTFALLRCSRSPATLCVFAEPTPDGKQLIFTAFDLRGRGRQLTRVDVDPKFVSNYVWDLSPDGTKIALLKSSESRLKILSLHDGSSREVVAKGSSSLESVDWATDSRAIFASSHTEEGVVLLRLDLQGNSHVIWEHKGSIVPWNFPFPMEGTMPWAVPSPDGHQLAIYEWSLSANMWMMENF